MSSRRGEMSCAPPMAGLIASIAAVQRRETRENTSTAKCSPATPGTRSSSSPSGSEHARSPPLSHRRGPRPPAGCVRRGDGARLNNRSPPPWRTRYPFTLDLFSNTSLASGLGLGVTAFPTTFKADDSDHAPLSAILHITDGRHAAIDLRLVDPAKRMRRATSSTPSSPMLSASGPRPAITPIGARTGSPSKNPAPGSSSSPILMLWTAPPRARECHGCGGC
jgi:hypothetical protein